MRDSRRPPRVRDLRRVPVAHLPEKPRMFLFLRRLRPQRPRKWKRPVDLRGDLAEAPRGRGQGAGGGSGDRRGAEARPESRSNAIDPDLPLDRGVSSCSCACSAAERGRAPTAHPPRNRSPRPPAFSESAGSRPGPARHVPPVHRRRTHAARVEALDEMALRRNKARLRLGRVLDGVEDAAHPLYQGMLLHDIGEGKGKVTSSRDPRRKRRIVNGWAFPGRGGGPSSPDLRPPGDVPAFPAAVLPTEVARGSAKRMGGLERLDLLSPPHLHQPLRCSATGISNDGKPPPARRPLQPDATTYGFERDNRRRRWGGPLVTTRFALLLQRRPSPRCAGSSRSCPSATRVTDVPRSSSPAPHPRAPTRMKIDDRFQTRPEADSTESRSWPRSRRLVPRVSPGTFTAQGVDLLRVDLLTRRTISSSIPFGCAASGAWTGQAGAAAAGGRPHPGRRGNLDVAAAIDDGAPRPRSGPAAIGTRAATRVKFDNEAARPDHRRCQGSGDRAFAYEVARTLAAARPRHQLRQGRDDKALAVDVLLRVDGSGRDSRPEGMEGEVERHVRRQG